MKNYIGIVRDHSGSMAPHHRLAIQDYNTLIEGIRNSARDNNIDTVVSVVKCGVGFAARVEREVVLSSIRAIKPLASYRADGSGTPLWDSVGELIDIHLGVPDFGDDDVSFLMMIITDGLENRSDRWTGARLQSKIKALQGTDHWSFAFRVPTGYSVQLQNRLGVPAGNILEWEQTEEGFRRASEVTINSLRGYTASLATGTRSTTRFYSDLTGIKTSTIKRELVDISRKVVVWSVTGNEPVPIKGFCEVLSGEPYIKGRAYYELVKTETVQDYKNIAIRKKSNGSVYAGHNARDLLGLPSYGSIRLSPGNHGDYEVFVQSTSVNRVLRPGSKLMYMKSL